LEERWDAERPLRLAGEVIIHRLGDLASKLPDEVIKAAPEVPWRELKGIRIIAAHACSAVGCAVVPVCLEQRRGAWHAVPTGWDDGVGLRALGTVLEAREPFQVQH
jgi:hypothetical protein